MNNRLKFSALAVAVLSLLVIAATEPGIGPETSWFKIFKKSSDSAWYARTNLFNDLAATPGQAYVATNANGSGNFQTISGSGIAINGGAGFNNNLTNVTLRTAGTTNSIVYLRGVTSQTGKTIEAIDSTGTIIFSVDYNGAITSKGNITTAGGDISTDQAITAGTTIDAGGSVTVGGNLRANGELQIGNKNIKLTVGNGSPEGVVSANPQSIYLNTNQTAGIGLYIKTNGTASVGWWLLRPAANAYYGPFTNLVVYTQATVNGNLSVVGGDISTDQAVTIGSTLDVGTSATFGGNVVMNGELQIGSKRIKVTVGDGSPEGQVTANPQSIYLDTNQLAGIGMYLKTNGTSNIGWWLLTPGAGGGGGAGLTNNYTATVNFLSDFNVSGDSSMQGPLALTGSLWLKDTIDSQSTNMIGFQTEATAPGTNVMLLALNPSTASLYKVALGNLPVSARQATMINLASNHIVTAGIFEPYDSDLADIAALATTSYGINLLTLANATAARSYIGAIIGTDVQAYDADLAAYGAISSSGLIARTGAGTAAARTLTAGSSKVSISNGDGVSGNPTIDVTEANLTLNNMGGILSLAKGGTAANLTDPNADRLMFWDDSVGSVGWLTLGTGLSITGTTIDATATGGGGTNLSGAIITNALQRTVWNVGSVTNPVIPWGATNRIVWSPASNAGFSMSGTPGNGTNEQIIHMTVLLTNAAITSVVCPTNGIDGTAPFFITAPSTNEFDLIFNGFTFYIASGQTPSTGSGPLALQTNSVLYTPTIRYVPLMISGVGGANTNFTISSTDPEKMINGFTNVSIRASMGYDPTLIDYWNLTITNGSGTDRTLEFSAVTNSWRFAGTYGTNAPTTLTNATRLLISARQHGTNVQVGYTYFAWP